MSDDGPRPPTENPFDSLRMTMATDPRDWSVESRDAWMYGIVNGWGDNWQAIGDMHRWPADMLARLRRLHGAFKAAEDGRRTRRGE